MEILVVSDTHGRASRLSEILERTNADTLLFLGDGLRDLSVVPAGVAVYAVRGNCDFMGFDTPDARLEIFDTCRVFMTHGHRYGVKSSLSAAIRAAAERSADVLLYGHTHVPLEKSLPAGYTVDGVTLQKPLLVLCPGSLGDPRDGSPTFGRLMIGKSGILTGLGKL